MRAVDVIRRKRDGGALSPDDIRAFVAGVTDGSWADYQCAALLMAILLRGMTLDEAAALTDAMVHSGVRVDLGRRADGTVPVDKHSTGGVGDKTSLILAPLAAACGAVVPMMSGRGLGHTGGTLDKLEAIPGFRTRLSLDQMRRALDRRRCAMIGQTAEIAPADKRLYSARRHRHGREHSADLRVHPEQEDRGRDRRVGHGCEGGPRRVHEDRR